MSNHSESLSATRYLKPALPVCPACGGLECLCRPRFFCGQILTDEDLNRLEHYIIEKNKLHNRYMHGWGVACGMEVSCDPCEGFVTVKAGYALSPCGNDIVVCRDEAVDVCELLRKCREDVRRHWECDPTWPGPAPECDREEDWVLYICYEEKPSRGITALRGSSAPACCSGCSCGGSSACGCGCHDQRGQQMKSSYRPAQKRAPIPQCEPTITCEGYSFQIRKVPVPQPQKIDRGAMLNRIAECFNDLSKLQAAIIALGTNPSLGNVNALREELLLLLERHGIQNCILHQGLLKPLLSVPLVPAGMPVSGVTQYFAQFIDEALRECVCSALLPPCPEPVDDDCVPLARVTINWKDACRILRVCNWKNRRLVPTVPALEYWLEGFVRNRPLAKFWAEFCCRVSPEQFGVAPMVGVPAINVDPEAAFNEFKSALKDFLTDLFK